MVGALVTALVMMGLGFLVSMKLIEKMFNVNLEPVRSNVEPYKTVIGVVGIILGIWNFFNPDFGAHKLYAGSIPILGALLPALLMTYLGVVLSIDLLESILNVPEETKVKTKEFIQNSAEIIGFVTIILGIVHIFTYRYIIF